MISRPVGIFAKYLYTRNIEDVEFIEQIRAVSKRIYQIKFESTQPSTISTIVVNINRFLVSFSAESTLNRKPAAVFNVIVPIVSRD